MWNLNARKNPNVQPDWFRADIPVMAEVILSSLTDELLRKLTERHDELAAIKLYTVFDRLRYKVCERKFEKAQLEYKAASFIADGGVNVGRVITSDEVTLINTANQLIATALINRGSSAMSGEELVQSSMITLYPPDAIPPSFEDPLSA